MTNNLDIAFYQDVQKRSKKSNRWIECTQCGKTITRASMVKHQISCHNLEKISIKG